MKKIHLYIVAVVVGLSGFAQSPRPADPQSKPIAITNATIHIGNGQVLENGIITFSQGKITAVSTNADIAGHEVISAEGKHVYPGMIMPATILGLEDISAVRPTVDDQEVGEITPNVRSQVAFNTESDILPTYRFNGILLAQVAPGGGLVTGTSSVMMLDGWNWEDATYQKDDAIHVEWPSKTFGPRWWMGETERRDNDNYESQVESILKVFSDAKAYHTNKPNTINLKMESMKGVVAGTQKVFVSVDRAREMVESVTKLKAAGVTNLVMVGARDAYYVRELLKENNIPVILDEVHRNPSREEEAVDYPFRLPGMLHAEGILVGLRHSGMLARGRNLPFYAGTAAGHGMDKEEALKLVTSNTAKILGIDGRTGTLEVGKDANLTIVDGDLLDMRSSIISRAFIQGRDTEIEGKQQVLYERFKEKYSE